MEICKISKENLKVNIPEYDLCGCFIAGGAIRDSIDGVKYSDIDIFGKPMDLLSFESKLDGYKKVYSSDKLKTFTKDNIKLQTIERKETETINSALDNFDFTICQFAYDGEWVYCNPESLLHIKDKRLVVHKISFPFDTLRRMQKYIKKGYTICNGGLLEIGDSLRNLADEKYREQVSFYPDNTARIMRFD